MIITIQKSTKGYVVTMIDKTEFVGAKIQDMTSMAGEFSDEYFKKYGIRPTIKMLPYNIISKEEYLRMASVEIDCKTPIKPLSIQSKPMAMKSRTYPAKPVKAVAKKGKVVKKAGKK